MSLHLLSFRPDFTRLSALAAREHLLPRGGDPGYALHAVFAAAFADMRPICFRLFLPGEAGGGPSGRLLAYSAHPLADLRAQAAAFADPAFANVLALDAAEDKPMPAEFPAGRALGFALRVRPVRRTGAARDGSSSARERDVYAPELQRPGETTPAARARVYAEWVVRQFAAGDAAAVTACDVTALTQTRLFVRDRSEAVKQNRTVDGPDVAFSGRIEVGDPAAFAGLLARGVGRFRAFGFGMILLRPPG